MTQTTSSVSEGQLSAWAQAPSETEGDKCQATVARITKSLKKRFGQDVSIFLQGSYRNRTNVRLDSDVDVVVQHNNYFFPDDFQLSESDKAFYRKNFIPSEYTFSQFKNDVQSSLELEFNYGDVIRKDKCILVLKDSARVNADVVPCFVHRRLRTPQEIDVEGIEFRTDKGERVYSFPEQHYDNGVRKNRNTDCMYKSVVRILKHIRNSLIDRGEITEQLMPSFFLECLIWNVPDSILGRSTFHAAIRAAIATIWNDMREKEKADNYAEASDLKWLFRDHPNRSHGQAQEFVGHVWNFLKYED